MPQTHRPTITITGSAGSYTAWIDMPSIKARPGHKIKWKVEEPDGFPRNGVVFLQFVDVNPDDGSKTPAYGCLIDGKKNHGKQKGNKNGANNHFVMNNVAFDAAQASFHYQIWYYDGSDHLLLDPEIVVEGNPDPTPIRDEDDDRVDDDRPTINPGTGKLPPPKKAKKAKAKKAKKAGKKSAKKKAPSRRAKNAKGAKKTKKAKKAKKAKSAKRSTKRKAKKR